MKLTTLCILIGSVLTIHIEKKDETIHKLPALHLLPNTITVSGASSGGYFSQMMLIIYSKTIKGVGEIAGGPFMVGADNY